MKRRQSGKFSRVLIALLIAVLMMSLCFAGTGSTDTVIVASAAELTAALGDAADSGTSTVIYYAAGTSQIELGGSESIPSNVTLDLSTSGGALRIVSGGVLTVGGTISGGAVEVSGGSLLRAFGSSITATITTSEGGVVRGARMLTLENLSATGGETITAVYYAGESGADTSAYVSRAATAVLYVKMTGSNYSSYKTIETVVTSAGNIFRLGTRNTDMLSHTYALTYGGLTGATLASLNPTSYTASDAATLLNNPAKEGFLFAGWVCEALGVTVPNDALVIPEGTTGELTFIAMWVEAPGGMGGGGGGSGGNGSATEEDAATQQEAAASQEQAATQQSTRRTRTASSSTKVSFTSDVVAAVPTWESVRSSTSFPWGWVFGELSALGILAYVVARRANRKQR
jgi:uncharacterized repeat protein (TIGR02543 family)